MPIYLQVVEQVKHAVASGALAAGERIPSVRDLALQLRVNPNTVAKAYQELQRQGVVETRRGSGVYVGETTPELTERHKEELVGRLLDRALVEAHHLGLTDDEVQSLLTGRAAALAKERTEAGAHE
jgi:GntR family transcriptional regulator